MQGNSTILVVGQFSKNSEVYCYADSFVKSFQRLGHAVALFSYYPPQQKNYFYRCWYQIWRLIVNVYFISIAFIQKPGYLFVIKGEFLYAKSILLVKRWLSVQVIWFYPDSPFVFWNGNGNSQMLKVLPFVDLYLSWSKRLMPLLEHAGAKRVVYFPFGYDTDIFVKTTLQDEMGLDGAQDTYVTDLLFVGTWSEEREEWFSKLVQKIPNLKLQIIGTGWMNRRKKGYSLIRYLYGDAVHARYLPYFFSRAKIILNFLRPQNFDAHNMRSIEVPATGNFLLTQRSFEQAEELFKEGESIVCFETIDELVEKIRYYLAHDHERLQIARAAYLVAKQYSLDIFLQKEVEQVLKKGSSGL